jgi:hypothetical protein
MIKCCFLVSLLDRSLFRIEHLGAGWRYQHHFQKSNIDRVDEVWLEIVDT